ncbi:hypothetical protein ACJX0J_031463, partial [Zea mays]
MNMFYANCLIGFILHGYMISGRFAIARSLLNGILAAYEVRVFFFPNFALGLQLCKSSAEKKHIHYLYLQYLYFYYLSKYSFISSSKIVRLYSFIGFRGVFTPNDVLAPCAKRIGFIVLGIWDLAACLAFLVRVVDQYGWPVKE